MTSDHQSTASASVMHVTQVAEGSYHLQLMRSDLNFTLRSVINRVSSYLPPCTPIIGLGVISNLIIMYPMFAAIAVDAVVAYSCKTDNAWELT